MVVVAVAALAVILLATGYWWYSVREREVAVDGSEITIAPDGKTVSGFPEELILEKEGNGVQSYRIEYAKGTSQPVLTYDSAKDLRSNIALFGNYLRENQWAIGHEASAEELPVTYFYAYKGGKEANITFSVSEGGKVQVVIAVAGQAGGE